MLKHEAKELAEKFNIPLDQDFYILDSAVVSRILDAADSRKYRKPKNANGSRARYFHAYLCRAAKGPKWGIEYVIQGNYGYGHGFEDECSEETYKEAKARLKEYRDNAPGSYRIVNRRVNLHEKEVSC